MGVRDILEPFSIVKHKAHNYMPLMAQDANHNEGNTIYFCDTDASLNSGPCWALSTIAQNYAFDWWTVTLKRSK